MAKTPARQTNTRSSSKTIKKATPDVAEIEEEETEVEETTTEDDAEATEAATDDTAEVEGADTPTEDEKPSEKPLGSPRSREELLKPWVHPRVQFPEGLILVPGEPTKAYGDVVDNQIVITQDVYRVSFSYNTTRPTFTLVLSKGSVVPVNSVQLIKD